MTITSAEARNLAFSGAPGQTTVNSVNYDGEILINTGITSPPNSLSGNYSLQSVAAHEIDEILGIGGTGSEIGNSTNAGDLDLFRYSAPGTRSYSTSSSVASYFSIDGGVTVLSYFNQSGGGTDYGDWQSNPDHTGFPAQVQDAYATAGVNLVDGPAEITAFNVIGYQVVAPEPSALTLAGLGLLGFAAARRRINGGAARNRDRRTPDLCAEDRQDRAPDA
jgi:hypothetical protein